MLIIDFVLIFGRWLYEAMEPIRTTEGASAAEITINVCYNSIYDLLSDRPLEFLFSF